MVKRPELAQRNKENAKHGMYNHPVYFCYNEMKYRCNKESHRAYTDYGGRGIEVCEKWLGEKGFENFIKDMGIPEKGLTLDRKDNNLGYGPENCRWVTQKVQTRNRRSNKFITHNGLTKCIAQWAEDLGIERKTLEMRLKIWTVKESLETPYKSRIKK